MFIILGALLVILLIILILFMLIIRVTFDGHLYLHNINLTIKVKVLKVTVFKYNIPYAKLLSKTLAALKENDPQDMANHNDKDTISREKLYQLLDMADEFMNTLHSKNNQPVLNTIQFKSLTWHTVVGLGEADLSAISVGYVWGIKAQVIRWLCHYVPIENELDLKVIPDFQQMKLGTDISCMIAFRVGKAIITSYRVFKELKGDNKSVRTSDSGLNENSHGEFAGND